MTTDHPDFDALSAHLDGEAPEWGAHVAGCDTCRATLGRLRATSALVAERVPVASPSVREQGLARALEAFEGIHGHRDTTDFVAPRGANVAFRPEPVPSPSREQVTPITSGRRRRGGSGVWVGVGSAAAVLVAFVIGASVLAGGGDGRHDATVAAGPVAPQAGKSSTGLAGESDSIMSSADSAAGGGTAGGIAGGDLGEIADGATLAARARPALDRRDASTSRLQEAAGSTSAAAPAAGLAAGPGPVPAPAIVGTRPCELEARTARNDLGTVVYYATGEVRGVPVVILGFASGPAPAPVTLLALVQTEGCRIVLEEVVP